MNPALLALRGRFYDNEREIDVACRENALDGQFHVNRREFGDG